MVASLGLVESVAEAVWCAVEVQLAGREESVGALGGLVLSWGLVVLGSWIVVDSWNVVVLLTLGWDGSWGGGGVLVVVVLGWARDWSRTSVSLEAWVVPSLIV
jgi:hypothetical protein